MADASPLRGIVDWLLDRDTCPARTRRVLSALVFAAFVGLVIAGALHHEIWRDEARALTLALEAPGVLDLPRTLENEGHPALWHLLLRLAHTIAGTPVVLKVVAALVGIGAAALVFFRAPLPAWWRAAFLFGWVPLYGCSVLCRNYGIGALLLFCFCACASGGTFRTLLAAGALALLANTNVFGTMIACALAPYFAVEAVRRRVRVHTLAIAVLLIGAGVVLAAWTMLPTAASKVLPSPGGRFDDPLGASLRAVWTFGANMEPLFGVGWLAWPVVLLTAAAALPLRHLTIAVLGLFAVAALFVHTIYGVAIRHLTMLYVFVAAVTWLRAAPGAHAPLRATVAGRVLLYGVWPLLLGLHGWRGLREVKIDIEEQVTAAPLLAELLRRDDLRGAILVGEPDYYLDALPYYRDNRIFVARENRFARRVSWTTANRRDLDLGELLAAARTLQREHGAPVLLVIGQQFALHDPTGDGVHGYGDHFRWTEPQQREFLAATEHVASLPVRLHRFRSDERYEVYLLRP